MFLEKEKPNHRSPNLFIIQHLTVLKPKKHTYTRPLHCIKTNIFEGGIIVKKMNPSNWAVRQNPPLNKQTSINILFFVSLSATQLTRDT